MVCWSDLAQCVLLALSNFNVVSLSRGSHILENQGMSGNSVLTGMSGNCYGLDFCCLSGNWHFHMLLLMKQ